MKRVFCAVLTVFLLNSGLHPAWANRSEISACHDLIVPLKNKRDKVAELDGIWGLFQKTSEFKNYSVQGINLDKNINSILFHLEYLCDTLYGIPFDELSNYISKNLVEKGEAQFKQELRVLGRNESEIAIWFKYYKFAVANKHRVLIPEIISRSIQLSLPYFDRYLVLAESIKRKENLTKVLEQTQNLTHQIDVFSRNDTYLSQAIHENSQMPYVDWDENHGGS